ncbi:hypothetical protein CVT26_005311, partial [Gymnopilus dilepis]
FTRETRPLELQLGGSQRATEDASDFLTLPSGETLSLFGIALNTARKNCVNVSTIHLPPSYNLALTLSLLYTSFPLHSSQRFAYPPTQAPTAVISHRITPAQFWLASLARHDFWFVPWSALHWKPV